MASPFVYNAVRTRLDDYEGHPVVYEGEESLYDLPDVPSPFVFVEMFGNLLEQDTIGAPGNNEWVETGMIDLNVMVPNGTGTGTARDIAWDLHNMFREQPIGQLFFEDMSIGKGEPGYPWGGYWAMTLSMSFRRRDITEIS